MTRSDGLLPENSFLVVNGAEIVPLEDRTLRIGRMDDNDIVIPDAHVSRYHAKIQPEKGKYSLIDLGSTGGTSVNGKKVTKATLSPGDVITLSGVPIIYGETTSTKKVQRGIRSGDPAAPKKRGQPVTGNTDSVDISSIDNYLDMFEPLSGEEKDK